MKTCKCCNATKELKDFFNNKQTKDGKGTYCKVCATLKIKPYLDKYKQEPEFKEKMAKYQKDYMPNYTKENRKKLNETIYNWNSNNSDKLLQNQLKYQASVPPAVYSITYKGDVIYVGSSKSPIRRQNVHFSTLTTCNNIGNVNKLHSYYGYDKADFKFHILEECDEDHLMDKEREYQASLRPDINYKNHFPIRETVRAMVERLNLRPSKIKTWNNRKYEES